jgi:hypothetical protein
VNRWLLAILAASGILGIGFAVVTPLGGAPDEGAHVRYVRYLLDEHKLPQLDLEFRKTHGHADDQYESHQPPLYYTLAVPVYAMGRAGGDRSAGMACRALSLLLGLLGTWLVWLIAREVSPNRPWLQIAATAFAALLPMRLAVNAAVGNDPTAEVTSSLTLLLLLRGIGGRWGFREAALTGVTLGAALLSKQNAILLFPPALVGVFLACQPRPVGSDPKQKGGAPEPAPYPVKRFFATGFTVLCIALGIGGWWYVRNRLLYGDLLGHNLFNQYFADTPRWENFRNQGYSYLDYWRLLVLPTTVASFWGAFGHLDPNKPELFMGLYGEPPYGYPPRSWLYPLLTLTAVASFVGCVKYYLTWRKSLPEPPAPIPATTHRIGVLALHAVFVAAALMNFNSTYFQGQGRYLFTAIAAISLATCAGWLEWNRRREQTAAMVIVVAVIILGLYALFGVVTPAFAGG